MDNLFREIATNIVWHIYHMNAATKVAFFIGSATIITNIVFSWINNNTIKKLKTIELNANIIASARIEWLETVRGHTAEFIKNYYAHVNEQMYSQSIAQEKEAIENYNTSFWLLTLYYTSKNTDGKENEDHIKILGKLKQINNELEEQIEKKKSVGEIKTDDLEKYITRTHHECFFVTKILKSD